MEMVKSRHKVFATHIPHNSSVQALSDVMSGRIDFMFIDVAIAMPQIRANRVRAIAVPNGVPPEILGRLNGELNKALATPEFREQLAQVGVEANPMTLEALAELERRDAARWAEHVKRSGARVD
jgi:tripartite-type tricarboxylate transporter receptor subunit TctC